MNNVKIEVLQGDNISVKERIIRFFEKKFPRDIAEELYNSAERCGLSGGTDVFDQAIELICKEGGLNSDELAKEISQNTIHLATPDDIHEQAIHNLGND